MYFSVRQSNACVLLQTMLCHTPCNIVEHTTQQRLGSFLPSQSGLWRIVRLFYYTSQTQEKHRHREHETIEDSMNGFTNQVSPETNSRKRVG